MFEKPTPPAIIKTTLVTKFEIDCLVIFNMIGIAGTKALLGEATVEVCVTVAIVHQVRKISYFWFRRFQQRVSTFLVFFLSR